jgi:hypothetical protein
MVLIMNNPIPLLTLDNNCIINLFDVDSDTATSVEEMAELVRLGFEGKVQIAVTTRVAADLGNDRDDERRTRILHFARMFPVVGTLTRLGVSSLGSGDVLSGTDSNRLEEEIKSLLYPGGLRINDHRYSNKINDVDHLVGHFINRRDIFVTDDQGILRKAAALRTSPGIEVMSPSQALMRVTSLLAPPLVPSVTTVPDGYISTGHIGRADFNYSNNNGRFVLGSGLSVFETAWSKASDTRIHAYIDPPSIAGVALVRDCAEIAKIADPSAYDYTSRTRTVAEGKIVIWRNVNGYYAAVKVLDIEDDTRGAAADRLVFEYVIASRDTGSFV